MRIRKDKMSELKESGINPYPNFFERKNIVKEIIDSSLGVLPEQKTARSASVAGRIMAKRDMGKLSFLDLHDDSGKIQIYISKDTLSEKDLFVLSKLDIGYFLGVKGFVYRTKRGELSVYADNLTMLSKSLRPLPAKWHGLKDVEIRYRKRYLDLIMNPEVKEKFRKKTLLLKAFREWMDKNGFLEVQTPILQEVYGGASAEPFKTHHNALDTDFYLRISTELHLKRLMATGFEKIYEIGPVFRNEGFDASHLQEIPNHFEFYWAYQNYEGLMKFTEDMISSILMNVIGTLKINYEGKEYDFIPPYPRIKFRDLILGETGIDVDKLATMKVWSAR